MAGFNWLDLLIIVFLLIGMAVGYAQGLVRQLIGLAALYVALVLATQFFRNISQGAADVLNTQPNTLTNMLAFFALLLIVIAIVNVLARDAYKSTRLRLVPLIDHITGMVLGLASMWIILSVAVSALIFAVNTQGWVQAEGARQALKIGLDSSRLAEVTSSTLPMIIATISPWLPSGMPALFNL